MTLTPNDIINAMTRLQHELRAFDAELNDCSKSSATVEDGIWRLEIKYTVIPKNEHATDTYTATFRHDFDAPEEVERYVETLRIGALIAHYEEV